MTTRKPILLLDNSEDSIKAVNLFRNSGVDYVEYDTKTFEECCCGELPATKAPSVFAVEEILGALRSFNIYSTPHLTHIVPSFILAFLIWALVLQIKVAKETK